ncbi:MAG: hypothetical protein ACLTDR_00775 [Adlercreutzia equolifaciens]
MQEALFDTAALETDDCGERGPKRALIRDEEKRRSLLAATDALQERFGDGTVRFGFGAAPIRQHHRLLLQNVEDYRQLPTSGPIMFSSFSKTHEQIAT